MHIDYYAEILTALFEICIAGIEFTILHEIRRKDAVNITAQYHTEVGTLSAYIHNESFVRSSFKSRLQADLV